MAGKSKVERGREREILGREVRFSRGQSAKRGVNNGAQNGGKRGASTGKTRRETGHLR